MVSNLTFEPYIFVKLLIVPQIGWKIKNVQKHQPVLYQLLDRCFRRNFRHGPMFWLCFEVRKAIKSTWVYHQGLAPSKTLMSPLTLWISQHSRSKWQGEPEILWVCWQTSPLWTSFCCLLFGVTVSRLLIQQITENNQLYTIPSGKITSRLNMSHAFWMFHLKKGWGKLASMPTVYQRTIFRFKADSWKMDGRLATVAQFQTQRKLW